MALRSAPTFVHQRQKQTAAADCMRERPATPAATQSTIASSLGHGGGGGGGGLSMHNIYYANTLTLLI